LPCLGWVNMSDRDEDDLIADRSGSHVTVDLSRDELAIVIGGVVEALYALGDEEFAIRVGPTAREARELIEKLLQLRKTLEAR
jgi:hypothetical protein